jgi:hypothetical protein
LGATSTEAPRKKGCGGTLREHTILEARDCGGPPAGEKEGILDGNLARTANKAVRPEKGMLSGSEAIEC